MPMMTTMLSQFSEEMCGFVALVRIHLALSASPTSASGVSAGSSNRRMGEQRILLIRTGWPPGGPQTILMSPAAFFSSSSDVGGGFFTLYSYSVDSSFGSAVCGFESSLSVPSIPHNFGEACLPECVDTVSYRSWLPA